MSQILIHSDFFIATLQTVYIGHDLCLNYLEDKLTRVISAIQLSFIVCVDKPYLITWRGGVMPEL